MQLTEEVWRPIQGFEGYYEVSNHGQVRSLDRIVKVVNNGTLCDLHIKGRILKEYVDEDGYHRVNLIRDRKSSTFGVHRLVAIAFIPNPENKPTVNHKDGDKDNNFDSNLEWATVLEQNIHAIKNNLREGTMLAARKVSKQKISKPVRCIETGQVFESNIEAERVLNLGKTAVYYSIKYNRPTRQGYTFVPVLPNAIN